jgi:hypothetical protein
MRWMHVVYRLVIVGVIGLEGVVAGELEDQIAIVLQVGKEGTGHAPAVAALKQLDQQPTTALIPLLQGIDRANPLAANWLTGAFEAVADRAIKAGTGLPQQELEAFALDRSRVPQARRLAYIWLTRVDSTAAERLVPGMLDDPAAEFRRQAVQRLIDSAEKEAGKSRELYLQAFQAARDPDQLDLTFDKLTELGEKVDLKQQLGLISGWWLIGPFDHRKGIGFNAVYPPEQQIDLQAKYPGMEGEIGWVKKESDQRHAILDLTKLLAPHKGAVVYAFHEFNVDKDQDVEFRLGTPNGWKLWVNGELAFAHEEYHQSMRLDQYRAKARLKAGRNRVLLKICQNEQTEDWAQRWEFQVRVCDPTGTAVLPIAAVDREKQVSSNAIP